MTITLAYFNFNGVKETVKVWTDKAGNIVNVAHRNVDVIIAFIRAISMVDALLTCIANGIDPTERDKPRNLLKLAGLK